MTGEKTISDMLHPNNEVDLIFDNELVAETIRVPNENQDKLHAWYQKKAHMNLWQRAVAPFCPSDFPDIESPSDQHTRGDHPGC